MSPKSEADSDALTWAGDDAHLNSAGAEAASTRDRVISQRDSGLADRNVRDYQDVLEHDDAAPKSASAFELIALGLLSGIYLLYTLAWISNAVRTPSSTGGVLDQLMFQLGLWAAVFAAPLWYAASLISRRPMFRLLLLTIGVIVLIPIPFISGVLFR